jgi:hypothetical protein
MQHDPTASLLAQGTGRIVAMSGGGSGGSSAYSSSSSLSSLHSAPPLSRSVPFRNSLAAAVASSLSGPIVPNPVATAAALGSLPRSSVHFGTTALHTYIPISPHSSPSSSRSPSPTATASPPVVHPHGIPPTGQGIAPAQFSHLLSGNDTKPADTITEDTHYTLPPIATDKAVTKFTTGLEKLFTTAKATSIQFTISN